VSSLSGVNPWTRLGLRLDPAGGGGLEHLAALAGAAEEAGFDCLWLAGGRIDPFVTAAALAPLTSTIRLGCLDYPIEGRAPSLLAKAVASLDVISAGRAAVGVEVGAGARGRSREALEVLRLMLAEDAPTYEGEHFTVREAYNEPRWRRPGCPPLVAHLSGPLDERLVAATVPLVDGLAVSSASNAGRLADVVAGAAPTGATFALIGVVTALPSLAEQVTMAERYLEAGCSSVVIDAGPGSGGAGAGAGAGACADAAGLAALGAAVAQLLPAPSRGGAGEG
jgi:alkanesulfonate monooxygenase SsuD/methylene tetrahydromethanopterin reductase-like flavin-dependent oxidoreductase (luciferase family)